MNIAALIAGIVAAFLLGFVIYGPFLGLQRRWAEGTRISTEPPEKMPAGSMLAQIISLTLLALVIAMTETTGALTVAVIAILAVAAQTASVGAWAQKSGLAIGVDVAYALLSGVVMIIAHALL
ncbi:DUF1761 domain-containing protein [Aliiroseovarius sp. S1123]|jgi:hypothetical protein|uniref:DUF1761 family protein n=1 Tax=unclassified Aliiroseovarius TaxID=2623558 RepID=UPI001FF2536A|nr:DUF1761 family protein [Aliiroseovarius sp. S1123]MCK0170165.1 DUF1761 domain-containing protein [Aliiroseovarius sp. S1123]